MSMKWLATSMGKGRFWQCFGLGVALATSAAMGEQLPLDLDTAGDFVILAETGISSDGTGVNITGDMGVSPISHTAITGFALIPEHANTEFSESAQTTGKIYAANYEDPTPVKMTTAINDMGTAYTTAALRPDPDATELWAGQVNVPQTLTPGLYKWSTDVLINEALTLDANGDAGAVFMFQIEGDLIMASDVSVILAGDAQAKNIFWQVGGPEGAVVGTGAHIEGVILTAKQITLNSGATFNGKLLAQTRVNLHGNIGVDSDLIPPPQRSLEIISEHGDPDPMVGIHEYDYDALLTNTVTDVETIGGTQYVNVGWSMIGNEPALGSTNYMEMTLENDAVLTWLWETNYLLNATAESGGSVTGDMNGFYADGSFVTVEAEATPGNGFLYWTGDVSGPTNDAVQNLTMDQARTLTAHFDVNVVILEIISEHGIADPMVGIYTNEVGTLLTNTVTDVEMNGTTQYVNTGWSMVGNDPALGSTNDMEMVHENDAVLTWQWSTNYWLSLSATNGIITNATEGWKPASEAYELGQVTDLGYVFSHWTVNGMGQGSASTLNVVMEGARDVVAVFVPEGAQLPGNLIWDVVWVFDPRLGIYIGTLTITNPETALQRYGAPFGFSVESTEWHWLRYPTGIDADTGMPYVDITPEVLILLSGTGNGDAYLDPGESVMVGGIELMGRREPDDLVTGLQFESSLVEPFPFVEMLHPVRNDFDGDGITDMVVYHAAEGNWYIRKSSTGAMRKQNWGWDETVPVPGDYDGDGITDIAVFHPATGDWYILQSSDNQMRKQNWGWEETVPVPGDYDGDGITDIAVYHPATADWYILKSSDKQMRKQTWGWDETVPVPGDYDGDGITDIAVYHPAMADWYILQSSDNQMRKQTWGWNETMPVPGDFDGDGMENVAVYHPEEGKWYILQPPGEYTSAHFGWSEAIPPWPMAY